MTTEQYQIMRALGRIEGRLQNVEEDIKVHGGQLDELTTTAAEARGALNAAKVHVRSRARIVAELGLLVAAIGGAAGVIGAGVQLWAR